MKTILMIEDNESLCNLLSEMLKEKGYDCRTALDATSALRYIDKRIAFDLYIIDITLPDGNGFYLCKTLRDRGVESPIIFLTADSREESLLKGFELGGSDYVTKPYRIRELMARIDSQLKRSTPSRTIREYVTGDLVINIHNRTVIRDGERLKLRPAEFMILEMLVTSRSNVVSKQLLLENLWDRKGHYIDENTLNVHISRMRKMLGSYNGTAYIKNQWGVGFYWAVPIVKQEVHCD